MTTNQPTTVRQPQPRHRWYQFNLRTLLVLIIVFGVSFAGVGIKVQRRLEQRQAIKAIEAAGAIVMYEVPSSFFARSEWLQSILGDEVLLDVLTVGVTSEFGDGDMILLRGLTQLEGLCLSNTRVTDNGLEHLRGLAQFTSLDLCETQVTDNGLVHLCGLTQLEVLELEMTHVTDKGLEHLRGLTQLSQLNLGFTRVTDEGLVHLRGLTHLKQLHIAGTQVTEAGIADLRKSLPNLRVER